MYRKEMPTKYQLRKHEIYADYQDHVEYFRNTEIERIRMKGERVINPTTILMDNGT